ncbi:MULTISPECIES: iron-containing redox enzyme family protein [Streptomyces]|uniref:iron-containing redox enzyme family protein n=1 Tax=Streptomyces TaxID=1883 RepID=UPI001F01C7B2|nr:iron-containing redox enzyme family protein [Streptomyces alboflavus]
MTVTRRESPSRPPEPRARRPALPEPRGELSSHVDIALRDGALIDDPARQRAVTVADPYGEDLQLALYARYELHYQGFQGIDPELEWEPGLLALRRLLERRFRTALRADAAPQTDAAQALADLQVEPVGHDTTSVSHHLEREGTRGQFREYAALRSLYHVKEADPHVWVIPRLHGRAKAAMVAVEYDEFGAGRAEDIHAAPFADLMRDLGLATAYGHYLDAAPAAALATVDVMSLFGLHRSLSGALVGHFATVEISSPPGSRRLACAPRRLGAGPAAQWFYDEHVEALHEQVVRHEVVDGLLHAEPFLDRDVAFGVSATGFLEGRLGDRLLTRWRQGASALLRPLPDSDIQPQGDPP